MSSENNEDDTNDVLIGKDEEEIELRGCTFNAIDHHQSENDFSVFSETTASIVTTNIASSSKQRWHGGILYKRRDVFKKHWRDRFFVLDEENGIMSYYLIQNNKQKFQKQSSDDSSFNATCALAVDSDAEARGTIYLPGCTVEIDDDVHHQNYQDQQNHNEQQENTNEIPPIRYVFTISEPQNERKRTTSKESSGNDNEETEDDKNNSNSANGITNSKNKKVNKKKEKTNGKSVYYLATASEKERTIWVEKLQKASFLMYNREDRKFMKLPRFSDIGLDMKQIGEIQKSTADHFLGKREDHCLSQGPEITRLCFDASYFNNVPVNLTDEFQEMIGKVAKIFNDSTVSMSNERNDIFDPVGMWKLLLRKDGVTAVHKKQGNAFILRSHSCLNHNVDDLFRIISDINEISKYDSNIESSRCLYSYNLHTSLNYYAMKKMRGSKILDFCVASHWQVISEKHNNDESLPLDIAPALKNGHSSSSSGLNSLSHEKKSILLISFSQESALCPEKDERNFARADLILSAWLLQPVQNRETLSFYEDSEHVASTSPNTTITTPQCNVTYLSSIDFPNDLSSSLVDKILKQQALLPSLLDKALKANKRTNKTNKANASGKHIDLSNETYEEIVKNSQEDHSNQYVSEDNIIEGASKTLNEKTAGNEIEQFADSKIDSSVASKETPSSRNFEKDDSMTSTAAINILKKEQKTSETTLAENKQRLDNQIDTSSADVFQIYPLLCSVLWIAARFVFPSLYPFRSYIFITSFCFVCSRQTSFGSKLSAMLKLLISGMNVFSSFRGAVELESSSESTIPFLFLSGILSFPSIIWYLSETYCPSLKEIIFICSFYMSMRQLILLKLGEPIVYPDGSLVWGGNVDGNVCLGTGSVVTRFAVELKGVLSFIANAKEEKSDSLHSVKQAEIAVLHIVVKAAARALSEMPVFNSTRVSIPFFGVKAFYPRKRIDVSVVTGIHRFSSGANSAVLLKNVDKKSMKTISNELASKASAKSSSLTKKDKQSTKGFYTYFRQIFHSLHGMLLPLNIYCHISNFLNTVNKEQKFGSCVVLASPNSENSDVDIDVSPCADVNIVICVGGVRAMRDAARNSSVKPMLSMAIAINCPSSNVSHCRKFAERVQNLVQKPESCEE